MSTVRMLPRNGSSISAWTGSQDNPAGRSYYNASAGGYVDVPDVAATDLASQGFVAVGGNGVGSSSGPTSSRPTAQNLPPGWLHVDTTVDTVVMWDGSNWRNPVTGAVT